MLGLFKPSVKTRSMKDAKKELEQDSSILLLDVRSPEEYKQQHLPGSIHLPLDQIGRAGEIIPSLDAKVFVYCLSGARSQTAVSFLSKQGYKNVFNIGGIMEYYQ